MVLAGQKQRDDFGGGDQSNLVECGDVDWRSEDKKMILVAVQGQR